MAQFNYFITSPFTNPVGDIEKNTNELSDDDKAKTVVKKQTKKATAKTTKAAKKTTKKTTKTAAKKNTKKTTK